MSRRLLLSVIYTLALFSSGYGQRQTHVVWSIVSEITKPGEALLKFQASLEGTWHIYSTRMEQGGPLPTKFVFNQDDAYMPDGPIREISAPTKFYDSTFMMEMIWFSGQVIFLQKLKLREDAPIIKGHIDFMACNGDMCLPKERFPFSVKIDSKSYK